MPTLQNKRILLGISGGIAAYKSAELCRELVRAGAEVQVVMTEGAQAFITPLTLQALSGNRVHTSLLDEEAEAAMGHIELARWADLILVAPASASFLARLARGEASDLLSTLCLARRGPLAVAPAMNQAMWLNAATRENLEALQRQDVLVWGPDSGQQACGDTGPGRMLEPATLCELAAGLFQSGALDGLAVTITAGPTREALDPVRFLSNHSSGKMGYALARAAQEAGAKVTLVSGPVALPAPERVRLVRVESAQEMLEACLANVGDVFIGVAAVADYRPAQVAEQKIKKGAQTLQLELVRNPDILATVAQLKPRPFCVGFAAETEALEKNALTKLEEKQLDMIIGNDAVATFGQDAATVSAWWRKGSELKHTVFEPASKALLARELITLIGANRPRLP